jgi:phage terminase large subunit-like protein
MASARSSTSSDQPAWPFAKPLSHPPPLAGRPTEGPKMARFIESHCVYGEGDKAGDPVRLELFQHYCLNHLGELQPDGFWRYKRALIEEPKGNGKTPLNAWVMLYKLWHGRSPIIPIGASSFDQADLLFGDIKACVDASEALQSRLEAFEDRIIRKDGQGAAFKVSSKAGTNDGKRPSAYGADELHELTGQKEKTFRTIARGLAKRKDGLVLVTSTPGYDTETEMGRLHAHGVRVNETSGLEDPRFLFIWWGVTGDGVPKDDHDELRRLIRLANPAADLFLDVDEHVRMAATMPSYEYERYHLGRWTQVGAAWLPPGAWEACVDDEAAARRENGQPSIPYGREVVLGFDGSFSGDSTALVIEDLETRVQAVLGCWERPADARPDWKVSQAAVEVVIRKAFRDYKVRELVYDRRIWHLLFETLEDERFPVVEMPQGQDMLDAAGRMYLAVADRRIHHDGDPRLARHYGNAVGKPVEGGTRVSKETRESTRYIDLAIASIMAHDHVEAIAPTERAPEVWDLEDYLDDLDDDDPYDIDDDEED